MTLTARCLDIFDRMAFLWGFGDANVPGLAGQMARLRMPLEDWLRNRIRLPAYLVGHDDLRDYLRKIATFRPTAIYAYSKAAYLLALEADVMDFHCHPSGSSSYHPKPPLLA